MQNESIIADSTVNVPQKSAPQRRKIGKPADASTDQPMNLLGESSANFSYIFFPFRLSGIDYNSFTQRLRSSEKWVYADYHPRYMLRFVANKIDGSVDTSRCSRFHMTDKTYADLPLTGNPRSRLTAAENKFGRFEAMIRDTELFCFSTGICILLLRIETEDQDWNAIINSRYNMKSVGRVKYSVAFPRSDDGAEQKIETLTLLDIAKRITHEIIPEDGTEFFYYCGSDQNSLNTFLLSFIYRLQADDCGDRLIYLQQAVATDFALSHELSCDGFSFTQDVIWGVSDQSAVCIAHHRDNNTFIEKVFYKNFMNEYLFMFVYLMHQKYVLYHFMTCIDMDLKGNLEKLEDYKRRLIEFKTYFVFTNISETPQYQRLYEKASKAFSLESMYEDVNEPLMMIDSVLRKEKEERREKERKEDETRREAETKQREEEEKQRDRRDNTKNLLLGFLGLLGLYSALVDGFDLADPLKKLLHSVVSGDVFSFIGRHIYHFILSALMLALLIWIVVVFVKNREKKHQTDKDRRK